MIIRKISILNYKNIPEAEILCSSKLNCFFGNNGMGKTNLMDAIYYLSFCKSHNHTPEGLLIRRNEELCVLQGDYFINDKIEVILCAIRRGQRKQFKRNQKSYDKLSEHIGLLPLVMVSPADTELIQGGSEERRRLLDIILSQNDPTYLQALIQYNKNLTQRNLMLRNQSRDIALFEVIEYQMDLYARQIFDKRQKLIETLIPLFKTYYQTICNSSEDVDLCYISHLNGQSLIDQLSAGRERDFVVGYTLHGIHKDDLEMKLYNLLIRQSGSQGQKKTYLIALKLAQYTFLSSLGGKKPILLLDDIFDKLDAERVEQIIHLVSGNDFGQIFITDTNRKYLDQILLAVGSDYALFKVEKGEVYSLNEV